MKNIGFAKILEKMEFCGDGANDISDNVEFYDYTLTGSELV